MNNISSKNKQKVNELEQNQTYKCNDTRVMVVPVFKVEGNRTIFHSLGQMVQKEIQD